MKKQSQKVDKDNFDYKTIRSFEEACAKLGIEPSLPDVASIAEEFRAAILAHYRLIIVFKAINNGWIPDWSNWSQYKYYPWFEVLSSGFGFSVTHDDYACTDASVGSRLCTDTREKAMYIAEQFKSDYENYLLLVHVVSKG